MKKMLTIQSEAVQSEKVFGRIEDIEAAYQEAAYQELRRRESALRFKRAFNKNRIFLTKEGIERLDKIAGISYE